MSTHRLSEDQVAGELNKMVEFIKKEADEKAKEIELKVCLDHKIGRCGLEDAGELTFVGQRGI